MRGVERLALLGVNELSYDALSVLTVSYFGQCFVIYQYQDNRTISMKQILDAVMNGQFTKTVSINIPELLDTKLNNGFVVNDCGSVFQGHCRTHTLIHVGDTTLAFTNRASVKYRPSMPSSSKFVFDYDVDQFNEWEVEKTRCTNSLNLNNTDIQKTISHLMKSGLLEYTSKDEDALVLQVSQYNAEKIGISHSGLNANEINNQLMANIIKSPLFREMDSFFS